jgi:hypothetical protein
VAQAGKVQQSTRHDETHFLFFVFFVAGMQQCRRSRAEDYIASRLLIEAMP